MPGGITLKLGERQRGPSISSRGYPMGRTPKISKINYDKSARERGCDPHVHPCPLLRRNLSSAHVHVHSSFVILFASFTCFVTVFAPFTYLLHMYLEYLYSDAMLHVLCLLKRHWYRAANKEREYEAIKHSASLLATFWLR